MTLIYVLLAVAAVAGFAFCYFNKRNKPKNSLPEEPQIPKVAAVKQAAIHQATPSVLYSRIPTSSPKSAPTIQKKALELTPEYAREQEAFTRSNDNSDDEHKEHSAEEADNLRKHKDSLREHSIIMQKARNELTRLNNNNHAKFPQRIIHHSNID